MNSTGLKLEEKSFTFKRLIINTCTCVGPCFPFGKTWTSTWTIVMLEKNWQICPLFPVPELLVFHGKFKCLMQSGFFSQPSMALTSIKMKACQKPNYQPLGFYYMVHKYMQSRLSSSTSNHFRCLTLGYVNAPFFQKYVFASLFANESIQDTQITST